MTKTPVFIKVRHVMSILDVTERTAQRVLRDLRKSYRFRRLKKVLVTEFCEYLNLNLEQIQHHFK